MSKRLNPPDPDLTDQHSYESAEFWIYIIIRSTICPPSYFFDYFDPYLTQIRKKQFALLSWKHAYCVSTINRHFYGIVHTLPGFQIRIRKFMGLPDPDPLVRGTGMDPDPSIIKQKE